MLFISSIQCYATQSIQLRNLFTVINVFCLHSFRAALECQCMCVICMPVCVPSLVFMNVFNPHTHTRVFVFHFLHFNSISFLLLTHLNWLNSFFKFPPRRVDVQTRTRNSCTLSRIIVYALVWFYASFASQLSRWKIMKKENHPHRSQCNRVYIKCQPLSQSRVAHTFYYAKQPDNKQPLLCTINASVYILASTINCA